MSGGGKQRGSITPAAKQHGKTTRDSDELRVSRKRLRHVDAASAEPEASGSVSAEPGRREPAADDEARPARCVGYDDRSNPSIRERPRAGPGRGKKKAPGPMTGEQCRLVRENTGLVGLHLRRYVANLARPRRDRERDDLFQEGCLGLIEAARLFEPKRGIPFAAFALPRIHNAVSKALHEKFATVRVPPKRKTRSAVDDVPAGARRERCDRPKVCSLSDELSRRLTDRRHADWTDRSGDTIGDRLRLRYEHAVLLARDALSKGVTTRGDRRALVRILAEERFLIPREESRRALRQIARDTRSSYARVAQYDKQLGRAIRDAIETDPEFRELRRRARAAPDGGETLVDEELECALAEATTHEFLGRFSRADGARRAGMLHTMLQAAHGDLQELVRTHFASLPPTLRTQLLGDTADLDSGSPADVSAS